MKAPCFSMEIVITLPKYLFSASEKLPFKQKEAIIPPKSQAQLKHKPTSQDMLFHSCLT